MKEYLRLFMRLVMCTAVYFIHVRQRDALLQLVYVSAIETKTWRTVKAATIVVKTPVTR